LVWILLYKTSCDEEYQQAQTIMLNSHVHTMLVQCFHLVLAVPLFFHIANSCTQIQPI